MRLRKELKETKKQAAADGTITAEEQARIDALHDARKQQRQKRGNKAINGILFIGSWILKLFGFPVRDAGSLKNENNIFSQQKNSQSMNKSVVLGLVRHVLTSVGAVTVTNGIVTGNELETVASAVAILVGVVWSIAEKKKKPEAN